MVTTRAKLNTTAQGLGYRHRVAVERLFDALTDGSPCDWCGRPRNKDRTKNWDYHPASTNPANGKLQGDHSGMSRSEALRRGVPIPLPDRLLHGECNRQRGDGANDHLAASANGATTTSATQQLAMPWPW
jgi:hypothetical protein